MMQFFVERKEKYTIFLLIVLPIFIFGKYFLGDEIPGGADLIQYIAPRKDFINALLHGNLKMWNNYLGNGMPESAVCGLYPIALLLSVLPVRLFVIVFLWIHASVGSVFFYLFLKEKNFTTIPAFFFSLIYMFSIHRNGLRWGHMGIIAAISLFPAILFFVERYINRREVKFLMIASIFMALQTSTGLQYAIYADIAIGLYLFYFMLLDKNISWKKKILDFFAWVCSYILLCAFSILPSMGVVRSYSEFGASGSNYDTFISYSMNPFKIIQMLFPRIFGSCYEAFGIYHSSEMDIELFMGLPVLLLLLSSVFLLKTEKKELVIVYFIMILDYVYSCIAHFGALAELVYNIPFLGDFRCSSRALYIFYFFVIYLSAKVYMAASEEDFRYKLLRKCQFFTFNFLVMFVAFFSTIVIVSDFFAKNDNRLDMIQDAVGKVENEILVIAVIMIVVSIILNYNSRKWAYYFMGGMIVAITLVEVIPYSFAVCEMNLGEISNPVVEELKTDIGLGKVWDDYNSVNGGYEGIVTQNRNIMSGVSTINAYTAYNNPNLVKLMDNLGNGYTPQFNYSGLMTGTIESNDKVMNQNDLLSVLGVKYIVDSSNFITENIDLMEAYEKYSEDNYGNNIYLNKNCRDLFFPVARIRTQPDDFYTNTREYNLYEDTFVIESKDEEYKIESVEIEDINIGTNTMSANVSTENEACIYVSQNFDKRWKVYIDGQESTIQAANGGIGMITYVSKGQHTIEYKFFDIYMVLGLIISGCCAIFVLTYIVFFGKKQRSKNGNM